MIRRGFPMPYLAPSTSSGGDGSGTRGGAVVGASGAYSPKTLFGSSFGIHYIPKGAGNAALEVALDDCVEAVQEVSYLFQFNERLCICIQV